MSVQNALRKDTYAIYQGLLGSPESFPISFRYGGKVYRGLGELTYVDTATSVTPYGNQTVHTYMLGDTLKLNVELCYCPEYGEFEYVVYFENVSDKVSERLDEVVSADIRFNGDSPVLRGILGDYVNKYKPYCYDLNTQPASFKSVTGYPTHVNFPYFNLEHGDGGTFIALGWSGTWEANCHAEGNGARFIAVANTGLALRLLPSESIRTARVVMLPYATRCEDDAMNLWRRWFVNYNMPREDADGGPVKPFTTACFASDTGLPNSDGSTSERYFTWKRTLDKILAEKIELDYRWVDAGWYTAPDTSSIEYNWRLTGPWELDPVKWPDRTYRESVDECHKHGIKTLMWFEPERIMQPELIEKNYGYNAKWAIPTQCSYHHLPETNNNYGIPECYEWTRGRILKVLFENDIDLYREDHNYGQACSWTDGDIAEEREYGFERRGITENRQVLSHYRLHADIIEFCKTNGKRAFTDSCASGGGRNDVESLRHGVPFLRSDGDRTTTALRLSITTSFSRWIPFSGSSTKESKYEQDTEDSGDTYTFRASHLPIYNLSFKWSQNPNLNFDVIRAAIKEWRTINHMFVKDMYVLTPYHRYRDKKGWTVIAYDDAEAAESVILAYRMEECENDTCTVSLPFALDSAEYELWDYDASTTTVQNGTDLRQALTLTLDAPRSSKLIIMKRK